MTPVELVELKAALAAGALIEFALTCTECAATCSVRIKQIDAAGIVAFVDLPAGWFGFPPSNPTLMLCPRCMLAGVTPEGSA